MGVADQPSCHRQDLCPEPVPDELRPWTGALSGVYVLACWTPLCMPLGPMIHWCGSDPRAVTDL
jgi:hypothetical protein